MRKSIYLVVALLFPILIFLFLKFFGRNEFEVLPLYQEAADAFPSDCGIQYSAPYTIPDSLKHYPDFSSEAKLHLWIFADKNNEEKLRKNVRRLGEEMAQGHAPISVIWIQKDSIDNFDLLKKCVLLLQDDQSIALTDQMQRIRGQYDGATRKDTDRLIVELEIIFKNEP